MTVPTAPMVFAIGRFERMFQVPISVQADKVRASYRDGVLAVRLPKVEAVKPKDQDRRGVRSAGTQRADGEAPHRRPLTSTQ